MFTESNLRALPGVLVEFVGQKGHCLGDSGLVRWIDCHGDGIGAEVDESCLVQQVAGDGSWDSRARFHRK